MFEEILVNYEERVITLKYDSPGIYFKVSGRLYDTGDKLFTVSCEVFEIKYSIKNIHSIDVYNDTLIIQLKER